MAETLDSLLRASGQSVVNLFMPLREQVPGSGAARRARIAQLLGLSEAHLLCGVGFNPFAGRVRDLARFLGYPNHDALLAERNFLFIHDRYRLLALDDILALYAALGTQPDAAHGASDVAISRLNRLEAQVEETINPILIGGYKLEVQAIYRHRLAPLAFVEARLGGDHRVLRALTGEGNLMLAQGLVSPARFLRHAGISQDEKLLALEEGLLTFPDVDSYLAERPRAEDAAALKAALGRVRPATGS